MNAVLVTTGDPAGIGPDICLDIVNSVFDTDYQVVLIGDIKMLQSRAQLLKRNITFEQVEPGELNHLNPSTSLRVLNIDCPGDVTPGQLNVINSG